jgi:hypothetical protein
LCYAFDGEEVQVRPWRVHVERRVVIRADDFNLKVGGLCERVGELSGRIPHVGALVFRCGHGPCMLRADRLVAIRPYRFYKHAPGRPRA